MVWGPSQRPQPGNQNQGPQTDASTQQPGGGASAQTPQAPTVPGGGALTNPTFSGDHVLESIAKGNGALRKGAKGPAVRALQSYLTQVGLGTMLGRAGADGDFGSGTVTAVKAWQKANSLGADGVVGKDTLTAMDRNTAQVQAPQAQTPTNPQANSAPSAGPAGSNNGGLPKDFQAMWDAHPHNYQTDGTQNTDSGDLQVAQGWNPDTYSNTCAIRLSIMWNQLGGRYKITREKAKAAGLDPGRIPYSAKTGFYYILSAREMWIYMEKYYGKPHMQWPANGRRFKNSGEFDAEFRSKIEPEIAGRKGVVAFDKIFGFSGTGHVDIFNGSQLSDGSWYPAQALKIWFI